MNRIIVKGKTLEEALKKALAEFGCTIDNLDVKVLKHPGVFSQGELEVSYIGASPEEKTAQSIMRTLEKRIVPTDKTPDSQQRGLGKQNKKFQQPAPNVSSQPKQNKENFVKKEPVETKSAQPSLADTPLEEKKPQQASSEKIAPAKEDAAPLQPAPKPAQNSLSEEEINNYKDRSVKYLSSLLELMGIEGQIDAKTAGDEISINITSEDPNVIGYRGETLDALEHLALIAGNEGGEEKGVHLNLDCSGWRERRIEAIKEMALRQADKAAKNNHPVRLEPMNSVTRRLVHAVLSDRKDVSTKSEGKEPNRYIVIFPASRKNNEKKGEARSDSLEARKPNKKKNKSRSKKPNGKNKPAEQTGKAGE